PRSWSPTSTPCAGSTRPISASTRCGDSSRDAPVLVSRAVFLDRDGVLNPLEHRNGRPRAPVSLDTFELYPWAAECVGRLRAAGYVCVVVTNQPEVATGELAPEVLDAIHARLRRETGVDGIYACPHRDEHGCECRKPKPGMLLRAAKEHAIDLSASFLVGD